MNTGTNARSVRQFLRDLSLLPPEARDAALDDREEELTELAGQLRKNARRVWRRPASFALGISGAAWRFALGDWFGAAIAGAGAVAGGITGEKAEAGAYSYLFSARDHSQIGRAHV